MRSELRIIDRFDFEEVYLLNQSITIVSKEAVLKNLRAAEAENDDEEMIALMNSTIKKVEGLTEKELIELEEQLPPLEF